MKKLILILFITLIGCTEVFNDTNGGEITPVEQPTRIMPLGASRVTGNRPIHESYRFELWKDLTEANYNFDFVGTQSYPFVYPEPYNDAFDRDNEGVGGITSNEILENLDAVLNEIDSPDIVLFSSPTGNDIFQPNYNYNNSLENVIRIILKLREANPNVTIVIEKFAPLSDRAFTDERQEIYNRFICDLEVIQEELSTNNSEIILADMFTGFNSNTMLADDVHYNQNGAVFIADQYFQILTQIL